MTTPVPPLILHIFPTFRTGGAQMRFVAIANRFGRSFRHAIVAMDGRLDLASRLSPELDLVFPAPRLRKGHFWETLRTCRRVLKQLRPSLLITSNWGTIEWAMANAGLARHLHMEDGFGPEERRTQLRRRVLTRRLVLRRSTVLLPSRTLLRIATEIWRLPAGRLRYVPNGVDLNPPAGEVAAGWPQDGLPVIGSVAMLRAEKNLGRLVRAFAQVKRPARLVILGDGPDRSGLEALAQELGVSGRVVFPGHVAAPLPFYRRFDVFALSSDTEQMPLSVLEAMSAALPVASTDVGDVRDMVSPANYPYVVPCDEAALAGALAGLLADAALRAALGAANRMKAEQEYDEETMFRQHRELWSESNQQEKNVLF